MLKKRIVPVALIVLVLAGCAAQPAHPGKTAHTHHTSAAAAAAPATPSAAPAPTTFSLASTALQLSDDAGYSVAVTVSYSASLTPSVDVASAQPGQENVAVTPDAVLRITNTTPGHNIGVVSPVFHVAAVIPAGSPGCTPETDSDGSAWAAAVAPGACPLVLFHTGDVSGGTLPITAGSSTTTQILYGSDTEQSAQTATYAIPQGQDHSFIADLAAAKAIVIGYTGLSSAQTETWSKVSGCTSLGNMPMNGYALSTYWASCPVQSS